jgi:uncharacterized protein (DUF1810 family)
MGDPYHLERFVEAQEPLYAQACAELAAGRKHSHWIWFVFPQLKGLGASATSEHFGLASLAEARAYLEHPLLGARLRHATQLANAVHGVSAAEMFGYPDWLKFRSCMTLFAAAATDAAAAAPFREALQRFFAGEGDPLTRARLAQKFLRNFSMN